MLAARHVLKGRQTTTHKVNAPKYRVILAWMVKLKSPREIMVIVRTISRMSGMCRNQIGDTSRSLPVIKKI